MTTSHPKSESPFDRVHRELQASELEVFGAEGQGRRQRRVRRQLVAFVVASLALAVSVGWPVALAALVVSLPAWGWLTYRWMQQSYLEAFFGARRDVGTAGRLVGEIDYRVVFLVGRNRCVADETEKLERLAEGLGYLTREAERYGRQLRFQSAGEPLVVPFRKLQARRADDLPSPRQLRLLDEKLMRLPIWSARPGREFFLVVLSHVEHRSYARQARHNGEREYCVCAENSEAQVVAHEILHLFGARDLYFEGEETRLENVLVRRAHVAAASAGIARETAGSIMRRGWGPLTEVVVDPATAFSVGWSDRVVRASAQKA